jgi:hypothetical protein
MDKVLINDKRLTPTMQRVRSGSTQLFREKNKNDRTFISAENCDLKLNHEDKSMYAELIGGKWYWVCGCAECNGEPRSWKTYIECEKHDVCCCCGISRKEIKGAVWGGSSGWTCKPCREAEDLEIRREAFEKLGVEEPDCSYTDKIICPHCGSIINNDDIYESQDLECYICKGELALEVEYTAHYSTTVKGERITK